MSRPISTRDLLATERTFVAAITGLGFGRFEFLRIHRGELVLDPWPTGVRDVEVRRPGSWRRRDRAAGFRTEATGCRTV